MEKKNRDEVALRFAESLVAQMLQRAGVEFEHSQNGKDSIADIVVQTEDRCIFLQVKYTETVTQAYPLWELWLSENKAAFKRSKAASSAAGRAGHVGVKPPHPHLVIVTGNEDFVFADPALAPMLMPDDRTKVSFLEMYAPRELTHPGREILEGPTI